MTQGFLIRNKHRILLFFILIVHLPGISQVPISNTPEDLKKFPYLNSEYIKQNKIKSVYTEVLFKVPSKPIEHSLERDSFTFNSNGLISTYQKINTLGDTSNSKYSFDIQGEIDEIYFKNRSREIRIKYFFDKKTNLVEIKETDVRTGVVIEQQNFKYVYETYNQYKKYWINNEGLTFRYAIISLDDQNRIIKEEGRYIRGTNKHAKQYIYTNQLLTEYISNTRESTRKEEKYKLIYDENATLLEMDEYQDGAHLSHTEYLYENQLLEAILEKNMHTKQIKITKVKYSLY